MTERKSVERKKNNPANHLHALQKTLELVEKRTAKLKATNEQLQREITERKQTEEALIEERHLLHTLMDNLPDYIYFKDRDSRFIRINKAHAKVFGLDDPDQAIGKTDLDFFTNEHARPAFADEQEIIRTGQPMLAKEEKETWPDGRETWVSTTKMPLRDANGNIIGTFGISRDTTERKRAEEALTQEQYLLRTLLDNVPDNIYFKDNDSRFVRISKALADWFGLSAPAQAVGKTDFDFFTEEHARPAFEDEKEIMETGKSLVNIEEKETWPDGRTTWVSTTKVPLHDKQGRIIGTFGISRDITERKQAEAALMEERHLLRTLMDNLPDYIYFKDRDSRFIRINKAHAKVFGLDDPAKAIGKTDFDFFTNEHARPAFADEQEIIRTGQPMLAKEEKETWPDGRETWVSTTKMPLRDVKGNIIGTFGISHDTTERKRAEEALAKERNLLRTLIDNMPDRIYVKDTESRFIIGNKALANRMSMPNPDEIVGKSDFDFLPHDLAARFRADELAIIRSGQPLINREEPMDSVTGTTRWSLATKVPLCDSQGNIIGIVGIGRDITERKRAEEEREKLIKELTEAFHKINALKGLLPICANCKKIRDDKGYWNNVESYITDHADVEFTHGLCPDCLKKLYPEYVSRGKK